MIGAVGHNLKVAIFTDSTGPNTLVGTQQVIAVGGTSNQVFRTCEYAASLSNGATYWLCVASDSTYLKPAYDVLVGAGAGIKSEAYADAITGGSWDVTENSQEFSFYVDYTEGGGGGVSIPVMMYHYMNH